MGNGYGEMGEIVQNEKGARMAERGKNRGRRDQCANQSAGYTVSVAEFIQKEGLC